MQEALEALRREHFDAVVCLRADFGRKILVFAKPAEVQVIVNGSDANRARLIMGYAQGAIVQWAATRSDKLSAPGIGTGNAVLKQTVWFNEELRSRNFLVPGLVALIVTLIGALLTAMVMAREWERGTLEALFVTPVHIGEIIIGKLLPYFVLGLGGLGISVLMAVFLFDVPLRGSVWVLLGASSLFLLVALCMGLVISSVTKAQFVAGQVAMVTTFLPAFLLSGMIFDIASAPQAVRIITMIVPARYYVAILQTVFLAGNTASVIRPNVIALAVIAALFLLITRLRTRKRLS